ncbi:TolC family protein [Desulfovibrio intestinalis]|uniref:Outer membrane protein TolC n=1 Tax=Desulfovibrio intestinalis TaxID=58621 RepID=A0A7W8C455_9BACT|nr:TolC family protein [Desulfovibrio intestinalis]MBB5143385.1 outer membrane protein TolC [Desulfovibrio intestinalis]
MPHNTRPLFSARSYLPLLLVMTLFFSACASNKAGLKSPELPAKHWLEEAPGVPVENKAKLEAAVPNLYDPSKVFTYEDCVFLTIQQSPLLVNSAVDLEIKRVALTDAVWKYLPEPRMTMQVTNNLTRNNMDHKDTPGDYGRAKFTVGFYAAFPNPVATYFEHQVQKAMVNLAISTHRKAVGEAIYKIAQAYLQLQAQKKIVKVQKELLPIGKELISYWQQVESVDGRQGVSLNLAMQHQRELELMVEQTKMKEVMQLTQLKILAGVDPQHKLDVDTSSADEILKGFNGRSLKWDDRWNTTEDDLLLRGQIKLGDYNIMVAWAQYLPNMSISVNNSPPAGQYQPASGSEDTFLHLNFDFPLLDWGRRYRGVQTARMMKAQAFHEMARKRTDYSNKWLQAEQNVALAETELKIAKTRFDTAAMQYKEAHISFNEGIADLPNVADRQEAMVQAQIALIRAELTCELAQLEWMYISTSLQERFLGMPAKEVL